MVACYSKIHSRISIPLYGITRLVATFFLDLISTDQHCLAFQWNLIFASEISISGGSQALIFVFVCFNISQWILKIKVKKLFGLYQTPLSSPLQWSYPTFFPGELLFILQNPMCTTFLTPKAERVVIFHGPSRCHHSLYTGFICLHPLLPCQIL